MIHIQDVHRCHTQNRNQCHGVRIWLAMALITILSTFAMQIANARQASDNPPGVGIRTATLWWVVFNQPDACITHPGEVEQCGEVDIYGQAYLDSVAAGAPDPTLIVPNTDAELAVIYATGAKSNWNGHLRLTASIYRSTSALDLSGPNVVDPLGLGVAFTNPQAEIHLIVWEHGAAIPGELITQTLNFLEPFCSDPNLGFIGGDNICRDTQFAIFAPSESGQDSVFAFSSPREPLRDAKAILVRNGDMIQAIVETRLGN